MTSVDSNYDEDVVVIDRDDISNYNPEQVLPEPPAEVKKIRSWLQATDYAHASGEYRKHLASHMPGTGSWLTSSATYDKWLNDPDHTTLWIKGIPGSGKSVVAAHLIDCLTQAHPGEPVLYFFFRQIIDANHKPTALLRDWLDQILDYSPPLQKELKEYVKNNRSLKSLSMEDLWSYLRLAIANLPGRAFCVADALDEMDHGNENFIESLARFSKYAPNKVKVIITSRPLSIIEGSLRQCDILRLRLEERMVDTDISNYVEHGLKMSELSGTDRDLVREAIPGHANGIFLYAKLAMDSFLEPGAKADSVLRSLPVDLHEMYTKLLREHAARSGVPQDIQLLILQWVTHATRPLRLLELAEMVHITFCQDRGADVPLGIKMAKDLVRAAVGPLLEILPNETVCVIHHSFTEYLKCMTRSEYDGGYPILRLGATHGRLALACVEYLQAGCLDNISLTQCEDESNDTDLSTLIKRTQDGDFYGHDSRLMEEDQRTRLQHPFYAYAAAHWHLHVKRSCDGGFPQEPINSALKRFLTNRQCSKAWLKMQWAKNEEASRGVTPLHIAARYGLTDFAQHLQSENADVNAVDVFGRTPLWWAAAGGHADTVRILMQAGADPDADEKVSGLRPLHEAASKNHAEAVRALLEAGVDPLTPKAREDPGMRCGNSSRTRGHTPLMYACENGHPEALKAFLPFLTNTDIAHRALAWSVRHGRSKLVRLLLQHPGVDPNAKVRGDTVLYLACKALDRDTIVALVEAGADPSVLSVDASDEFGGIGCLRMPNFNMTNDEIRGYSVLYALCGGHQRGYSRTEKSDATTLQELFDLLLQRGACVHVRTQDGRTALHVAVHSPVLTRLLLRAGADANVTDNVANSPLHLATSPESIALLVEEGNANVNSIVLSDGKTPLMRMLDGHHKEAVRKLLGYRPDLTTKSSSGEGPMHLALKSHSVDSSIIKALIDAGADPDEHNRAGDTPLLAMRMDNPDSIAIVDLLLKLGADINAKDRLGRTVLSKTVRRRFYANRSGHADIRELLDRGADLHIRDYKGKSLLHHAVATSDLTKFRAAKDRVTSRLDHLLSLGLDVQVLDYRGNSLIHEVAMRSDILDSYHGAGLIRLLEQLLVLGVDIDQGNQQGRTALHILSASSSSRSSATCKIGYFGPLDFVISRCKHVDQCDNDGITALHLASTVSEYVTKKLLGAGADPHRKTNEDLTPLHLAARTRQSNIVGMLLNAGVSRSIVAVNAHDTNGNTPMYYACRSGVPETVNLLVDAGADTSDKSLWLACAEFENEVALWKQNRHPADVEINGEAGGLMIDDDTRPGPTPDKRVRSRNRSEINHCPTRLEEIVNILLMHGCNMTGLVGQGYSPGNEAISRAVDSGSEYTLACLTRARDRAVNAEPWRTKRPSIFLERIVALRQDAVKTSAIESARQNKTGTMQWLIESLLNMRQYHALRPLFDDGVNFLADEDLLLELFVRYGYASLLDEIGSLEVERRLSEGRWHAFGDKSKPGLHNGMDLEPKANQSWRRKESFLLLTAIDREAPNMEVVRLLVEKFHVDVNEFRYVKDYAQHRSVRQNAVLHELAKGGHWWHAALAIPFMISKGADVNARDRAGRTPLHVALGGPEGSIGPYHKDAARALLAGGADVNVADNMGISCLASTAGDVEMVQLLLRRTAEIRADALFMALHARSIPTIRLLLEAGADPNMRVVTTVPSVTSENVRSKGIKTDRNVRSSEEYPLHYAATHHGVRDRPRSEMERQAHWSESVELMQALLASGADPFATFNRWTPRDIEEDDHKKEEDESVRELLRDGRVAKIALEEVVLAHELLEGNNMIHPILALDTLDANRRDANGRTLLHMACHHHDLNAPIDSLFLDTGIEFKSSMPSFLDCLLAHGADPLAIDASGNNILHHMFIGNKRRQNGGQLSSTIARLTQHYPALLDQANNRGQTPLHVALKHAALHGDTAPAEALLNSGADPLAIDSNGNTCLHTLAFAIYESPNVRVLFSTFLQRGLNINAKNKRGETPIFNLNKNLSWIAGERISAADALLIFEHAGADLFAQDNNGRGLLHVAAKETREPVKKDRLACIRHFIQNKKTAEPSIARFQVLLSKGLDPMKEDAQKRSSLDVAAACGKESILKLFENGETRAIPIASPAEEEDDDDDDDDGW